MQPKNTPPQNALSPKGKRQLREAAKKLIHEKYVLENGLTVVLNPDHKLQAVAVHIQYKVGACRDFKSKTIRFYMDF